MSIRSWLRKCALPCDDPRAIPFHCPTSAGPLRKPKNMAQTALLAPTIYTPRPISNGVLLTEDDRIRGVGTRDEIEIPTNARVVQLEDGFMITPGFIDTHNHGAGGHDVMETSRESLDAVCRTLARLGTTSYYPTTLTAPTLDIRRAVEFLAGYLEEAEKRPAAMSHPLGIHMEGPYISVKRRGVHPAAHIVEPTLAAYRQFAEAARGKMRIMTVAPELKHAPDLIREMIGTGVQPSMGHTDSTFEQAEKAVELGVRQATHMFNAMRPFTHRDPGVIGKVLNDPTIKAELIADGVHVDPHVIQLLYRCKGADGIVLISDGLSAVGAPEGTYRVGGLTIEVKDGVCRHNDTLAGSILTIARAVRNMRDFVGLPLEEAIQMGTLNTAQLMGISERKGCLKPGADADLVILDKQVTVRQVYVRGLPVE